MSKSRANRGVGMPDLGDFNEGGVWRTRKATGKKGKAGCGSNGSSCAGSKALCVVG